MSVTAFNAAVTALAADALLLTDVSGSINANGSLNGAAVAFTSSGTPPLTTGVNISTGTLLDGTLTGTVSGISGTFTLSGANGTLMIADNNYANLTYTNYTISFASLVITNGGISYPVPAFHVSVNTNR